MIESEDNFIKLCVSGFGINHQYFNFIIDITPISRELIYEILQFSMILDEITVKNVRIL